MYAFIHTCIHTNTNAHMHMQGERARLLELEELTMIYVNRGLTRDLAEQVCMYVCVYVCMYVCVCVWEKNVCVREREEKVAEQQKGARGRLSDCLSLRSWLWYIYK
jgi:hypothetical protein